MLKDLRILGHVDVNIFLPDKIAIDESLLKKSEKIKLNMDLSFLIFVTKKSSFL